MAHKGEHDAKNEDAPLITYNSAGVPDSQPDLNDGPPDYGDVAHVTPGLVL